MMTPKHRLQASLILNTLFLWILTLFIHLQQEDPSAKVIDDQPPGNLPYLKPDDVQYFDKLLVSIYK